MKVITKTLITEHGPVYRKIIEEDGYKAMLEAGWKVIVDMPGEFKNDPYCLLIFGSNPKYPEKNNSYFMKIEEYEKLTNIDATR